jgi:CO/xanthine dehydrogenase Mo-binding subunit
MAHDHRPPALPHVGRNPQRSDGLAKVQGTTQYVDDVPFDGWYGATVRTPIARGVVKAVRFLEGPDWREFVIATAKDVPARAKSVHAPDNSHGDAGEGSDLVDLNIVQLIERDQPYLVRDVFRHMHEPVVLLAHPDPEIVRWAATRVEVICEALPAVVDYEQEITPGQVQRGTDNALKTLTLRKGAGESQAEIDQVFADAACVVEGEYHTGAQEQAYIEPQGMIADVRLDPQDQAHPGWPKKPFKVRIEGSLQCPYYVHTAIKHLCNLPDELVEIAQTATGGGFGGKEDFPSILAGHAVLLSMKARRPVKIIYDRIEDMLCTTKRHPSRTRLRSAHGPDGKLLALQAEILMDGGAYVTLTPVVLSRGTLHCAGPYEIPHVRIDAKAVLTNTPPNGAFRGFGAPQTIFAMERHLDRVADQLRIDPAELRRRNFVKPGLALSTGQVIHEQVDLETWTNTALADIGWEEKRVQYKAFNEDQRAKGLPLRRGVGMASFMHGCGFTGSGEVYLASKCKVRVAADGIVEVCTANTEIGQGAQTIFAQVAADALGLELSDVRVIRPDTAQVPNSGPTVASRTSMVVGHLVSKACDDLVRRMEEAGLLKPEQQVRQHATPSVQSDGRGGSYLAADLRAALQAAAAMDTAVREGWSEYQPPPGVVWDDKAYKGIAYGTYAWAVYVCDLQVDTTTMEVEVRDFVALQEIGRVLHPTLAVGQIAGGVVQGLGWALWEEVRLDAQGAMRNANLTSYVLPTMADVPTIRVRFEENPYGYGPFGAKGIGELPMDGPAPAVCNALSMALGADVNAIPATAERLLQVAG